MSDPGAVLAIIVTTCRDDRDLSLVSTLLLIAGIVLGTAVMLWMLWTFIGPGRWTRHKETP